MHATNTLLSMVWFKYQEKNKKMEIIKDRKWIVTGVCPYCHKAIDFKLELILDKKKKLKEILITFPI